MDKVAEAAAPGEQAESGGAESGAADGGDDDAKAEDGGADSGIASDAKDITKAENGNTKSEVADGGTDASDAKDGLDHRIRKAQSKAAKRTDSSGNGTNARRPNGETPSAKQTWDLLGKQPWPMMTPAAMPGSVTAETLLGTWADSLGNSVTVFNVDAYSVRMCATLSQPPRRDITLKLQPVLGGGWVCGNAMLDPAWSTANQLHWLTTDGRISVWVRPQTADEGTTEGAAAEDGVPAEQAMW
mmetsp:Transcript_117197/g.233538  ORF Transcript_117197/g.233538 Transcript_117197/m.233538 type:complete len:243 (+) Transcript_117197:54-782(+)